MKLIEKFKEIINKDIETQINKAILNGTAKEFDDEFYNQFNGMYFHGLPIYYYVEAMNLKRCYDTSAILGLAMKDCNICRGELKNLKNGNKTFGHGWVEKGSYVFDTTWKVCMDKKLYYKIFGAKLNYNKPLKEFAKDYGKITDYSIHDKSFFENKPNTSMTWLLIDGAKSVAEIFLNSKTSTVREKYYAKKLLSDVPVYNQSNTLNIKIK